MSATNPHPEIKSVLIEEAALASRVAAMAHEIQDAAPRPDILVVGLLTGSFMFVADLMRALGRRGLKPEVEFVRTSLYGDETVPGQEVRMDAEWSFDVAGRAVLVVDDILDSGRSMRCVTERLRAQDPAWLKTCVLLDKPARRTVPGGCDFVGFSIPDVWVVGYGLDQAGALRDLPYVGEFREGE